MVRQCSNCEFYNKQEDQFRQQFVDILRIGEDEPQQHFCPMYDSHIPTEIYYDGGKCKYYTKK